MAETATTRPDATGTDVDEAGLSGSERLISFSDAVIAIAMTLLALELPVPDGNVHGNAGVLDFLREHLAEYTAFLVSFVAVAFHWLAHQRLFRYATGLTGKVVRWNLLWLLMIVIMPFTTKLQNSAADAFQVQFILYAANQTLAGIFFRLACSDLVRSRLLRPNSPAEVVANTMRTMTSVSVIFAVAIPVALVTRWASMCWVLFPLVLRGLRLIDQRRASALR